LSLVKNSSIPFLHSQAATNPPLKGEEKT